MRALWCISRRRWLTTTGAALLPFGSHAFAARVPEAQGRLIVVFLRGAVDGLNVVVPYDDPDYAALRPTIGIAPPGAANGALDLDGHFGLHPALESVMPLWRDKSLAFIHAAGSPDPSRSHFDAQDFMESGTPGHKNTQDGWMNRLLAVLPGERKPTDAIAFGPTLPRILSGRLAVSSVPNGRSASAPIPLDRPVINAAFDKLYAGDDALARAYREGVASHKKMLADLQADMTEADAGAPLPNGFAADAAKMAKMMRQDQTVTLGFFALGGWDTHINQGAGEGQLAQRLKPLGEGLTTLARELGPLYPQTAVLVISEFGRTAHENGNRGTDHGHGNVMWVMGGRVAGGRVYGLWPGLSEEALYQKRDLAVTTDFRSAIAAVLAKHMGLDAAALVRVFPELPATPDSLSTLIGA
jgi:uncharacterized protein (DUF1501 family)